MRTIYVFYADVFWLQNFLMDFLALTGVNYFLKRRQSWRKLALLAGGYSVASVLLLLLIHNYFLYLLLVHFVLNTSMVWIGFGRQEKRTFLENWGATYLIVVLGGGMFQGIMECGLLPQNYMTAVLLTAVAGYGSLTYLMHRREFTNQIFEVCLKKENRKQTLRAYWDSGNQLKDPYTGQAISILSYEAAGTFVNRSRDAIRIVPYSALGTEHGLMEVFTVEELCIYDGKMERQIGPAAIGIANPGLLEHKEYDMILHASLL